MTVTRKEWIEVRKNLLKEMDDYVRNKIGDKIGDDFVYYDVWASEGVPDGADELDYHEIAEQDDLWLDCVKAFAKCCRME